MLTAGFALATLVASTAFGAPAAAKPSLDQAVTQAMGAAKGAEARSIYELAPAAGLATIVEPDRTSKDGRWVFGGAAFRVPTTTHAGPVTALFFGHLANGRWEIALEGSEAFARASADAPADLMGAGERATLASTAAPQTFADSAATGLALPWKANGGNWRHWGVHGDSGTSTPYNAIDFYGGDRYVRAAAPGRLYRFCGTSTPYIKVVHDNGWTTGYYHTYNQTTVADGSQVALGAYIGEIGEQLPCGGRANGDHVHWTLWKGNTAVGVNGKEIGGWTWYAQSTAYQGYAVRGSTRINNSDCCLTNYGPGDPGSGVSAPVYNPNGSVNIRSGPSSTATVVRSVASGTTVNLVCYVNGDTMTGPWNNTSKAWDRLDDGNYVSDAWVDTGSDTPVVPACT
ncbi:peptidoglycan DD-metalloendopeptidase family protein [Actinorhabdospora filicis]|uniref:peptidoglycan DD-metalloendopeptidase family protein n=1 Tax=Actinorhabdospora filicis TaxID=1785913 RepID=UPI0025539A68|nr:peptidoglycan DD-metalloendopeptidase family protein [Actinorhabdospora filicis]